MFIYFFVCRFLTFFKSVSYISTTAYPFLIPESRIRALANYFFSHAIFTGVALSIYSLHGATFSYFTKNQRSDTDFGSSLLNDDEGWPMNSPN
jgi:hypothetical protein